MIIPTILEQSWEEIEKKFETYKGFAKSVHIDFLDGKFEENLTFLDPVPFSKYSEYFDLEAHLMVEEPIDYIEDLSKSGFKTFLGHIEKMSDQVEFVARGQELGGVGLALDIDTLVSDIKVSYEDLDRILLMGIHAGASGRPFDERVFSKIKEIKDKGFTNIEIDGGVSEITLPKLKEKGANMFCVNSFLFKGDPKSQFRILESL
ncbi:MAG: hypothetical protein KBD51_00355 [Candidatus Levybacteria bacterium]|nr:hypothetical protein [Candidatus Levybacteria bacterium]